MFLGVPNQSHWRLDLSQHLSPDGSSLQTTDVDPIVLIGVQFLLAFLGGGAVAVIAAQLARRDAANLAADARRVARQERERNEMLEVIRTYRALTTEASENIETIDGLDESHLGLMQRSAWDSARTTFFHEELRMALARAYAAAERYNRHVSLIETRETTGTQSTTGARRVALQLAAETRRHFEAARSLLGEDLPDEEALEREQEIDWVIEQQEREAQERAQLRGRKTRTRS